MRFVFDVSFWILVNIVCLNIIFGIIIDTFTELRVNHLERAYDQFNKCFICGLDRKTFDKKGVNFNIHIFQQHYMWNYVYLLIGILAIDKHELTGYEYYVRSRFSKKATYWIPINKTIYLTGDEEKKDKFKDMAEKLKKIQDNIFDYIDKKFDELAETLNDKLSQAGV